MTRIFISGATGFIGSRLADKLAGEKIKVHALYRDPSAIKNSQNTDTIWFRGDLADQKSLDRAMKGCRFVFHLAAHAKVWARDSHTFRSSIFDGTVNIMESAIRNRVEKVVITSTAGVFGPSVGKDPVTENSVRTVGYFSEYEKYKDLADHYIMDTYTDRINFCIVCPTRVYGPGLLNESNSVTKLLSLYLKDKFRFLPGNGESVGNYVYVDDVINGMLFALQKGKRGERYILGGENASYIHFFRLLREITGKKQRLYKLPVPLMLLAARLLQLRAGLFGIAPLITPGWVRKFMFSWHMSSEKSMKELGYQYLPLKAGLRKTLVWILSKEDNNIQV